MPTRFHNAGTYIVSWDMALLCSWPVANTWQLSQYPIIVHLYTATVHVCSVPRSLSYSSSSQQLHGSHECCKLFVFCSFLTCIVLFWECRIDLLLENFCEYPKYFYMNTNILQHRSMVIFTNVGCVVLTAVRYHQAIFNVQNSHPQTYGTQNYVTYPWADLSFFIYFLGRGEFVWLQVSCRN